MAGLEDLTLLQHAESVADGVWQIVGRWDPFARETVGKQLVRAIDSVGANIAEAFGRFHYGEKINFLYFTRGSVFESKYWLNRAKMRGLIDVEAYQTFANALTDIAKQINNFVRSLKRQRSFHRQRAQALKEPGPIYNTTNEKASVIFSRTDLDWLSGSDL